MAEPIVAYAKEIQKNQIIGVKYFTAKVSGRSGDQSQPQRQELYWRALRTIPSLEIICGHFREREIRARVVDPPPNFINVFKTEEKGSDVNLATNLLMDGFRDKYEVAIVISGDSDLITPIKMIRDEIGKPVGVVNPQLVSGPVAKPKHKRRKNAGLKKACSFYHAGISWNQLSESVFPDTLTDCVGSFTRPSEWR